MQPDVMVENHGTVFLFAPLSDAAKEWVRENVVLEPYQWLGPAFSVEHRYARDLAAGMQSDGLVVE